MLALLFSVSVIITAENASAVFDNPDKKPVLLKLWATWCPHCKEFQPTWDELESDPDLGHGDPSNRDHIIRAVTMNGLLRPSSRRAAVSLSDPDLDRARGAMEIMNVDPKTGRGFVTRRDRKESVRCLASACVLFAKYLIMHGKVERRYRGSLGELTSYDSWVARLGL